MLLYRDKFTLVRLMHTLLSSEYFSTLILLDCGPRYRQSEFADTVSCSVSMILATYRLLELKSDNCQCAELLSLFSLQLLLLSMMLGKSRR